jgi:hypothetical protein
VISVDNLVPAVPPVEDRDFSPGALHGANGVTAPLHGVIPGVHNAYYVYERF